MGGNLTTSFAPSNLNQKNTKQQQVITLPKNNKLKNITQQNTKQITSISKINRNNYRNKSNNNKIFLIRDPNNFKNKEKFPKFEFEGGDTSQCVKFYLKTGDSIQANGGAMNYMSNGIEIETTINNISKGFWRSISGASIFYNIFNLDKNTSDGFISFAGINLGNIACFYIPFGKKIRLISDSYICSTPNLTISGKAATGGIITGYGLFYLIIEANDGDGLIWANSFGKVLTIDLKPDEIIKIDNGVFLGMDDELSMETTTIGGIKSFLFGGQFLLSEIQNVTSIGKQIFLESRSKAAFVEYINNIAKRKVNNAIIQQDALNGFSKIFSDE